MVHGEEPDLYGYLATSKVSDVTVAQLQQSLENSFIAKSNIEFWKGPITVHRLLEVSRTYPWGLPIPNESAIEAVVVEPLGQQTIQPPGTEEWQITGLFGTGIIGSAVIDIAWYDGSADLVMVSAKTVPTAGSMIDINEKVSAPFILTNSMYLLVSETGGSNSAAVKFAYHKVSL